MMDRQRNAGGFLSHVRRVGCESQDATENDQNAHYVGIWALIASQSE